MTGNETTAAEWATAQRTNAPHALDGTRRGVCRKAISAMSFDAPIVGGDARARQSHAIPRSAAGSAVDDPAKWRALGDALLAAVEALPGKKRRRGQHGSPGYTVSFSAPNRTDRNPSAYLKPYGDTGSDGRPVWGDAGGSGAERGTGLELAATLGVDVAALGFGPAIAPAMSMPSSPTPTDAIPATPKPFDVLANGAERRHVWRDAVGAPIMAVLVHRETNGDKRVWNARPLGDGWIAQRPEQPPAGWPLYRLPDILAAETSRAVFVTEGEKDADALAALGLVATTTLGGAGKASAMDWTPLAGRRVVVLPDHDVPGREHADTVARCAIGAGAAEVSIVPLPGEPWGNTLPASHGRDVSDWLADGGMIDALVSAAAQIAPIDPLEAVRQAWPRLTPWDAWGEARPIDWAVPDLVPSGAFVLLYGPPGCGKSLVALDWAASAAADGLTLYIVGEGSGGIAGRVEAWRRVHNDDPPAGLTFWRGAVQIAEPTELYALIDAIGAMSAATGLPPRLIVLDTLACCTLGRDENNASDAGLFAAAVGRLQETGAAVVVIHHPDKAGRGPRGSGAFLGAADVCIRADATGHAHRLTVEKSKDGGREGWTVVYRRAVIDLALDDNGDPVTGAAAKRTETRAAGEQGTRPERAAGLTTNRRAFLEAIVSLIADSKPATMSAIIERSGLEKNRAAECAKWARGCSAVEGGDGDAYRPGKGWPPAVPIDAALL